MRRTLLAAACSVLVALAGQCASAALIDGQFVPDSLVNQVGKQYRLIFVTSGTIEGNSSAFGTYDTFLNTQVGGTMLGDYNYGWRAVISTADGLRTAKGVIEDQTNLNPSLFQGIYNTQSQKVSSTGAGMLDNSLDVQIRYDQHGTSVDDGYAWTGSEADGDPYNPVPSVPALDWRVGSATYSVVGDAGSNLAEWILLAPVQRLLGPQLAGYPQINFTARVYGMSNVLTVPVPEPATIVMWSLFAGVAGLVCWRKGRKNS